QWLRRTPEPMAQQARWLAFIEQFQYSIEHRPGNRHSNADALSRLPHPCKQCSHCSDDSEETVVKSIDDDPPVKTLVRSIVADLMIRRPDLSSVDSVRVRGIATSDLTTDVVVDSAGKSVAEMQSNDPSIGEFVKLLLQYSEQPSIDTLRLSSETTKILWSQWFRYVVKDGVVYRLWFGKNGEPSRMQLLVPHEMRDDITRCVMILSRCQTVVCVVAIWALLKPATKYSDVLSGLAGGWTQSGFVVVVHNVVHIIVANCLVVVHCSQSLLALRLNE